MVPRSVPGTRAVFWEHKLDAGEGAWTCLILMAHALLTEWRQKRSGLLGEGRGGRRWREGIGGEEARKTVLGMENK